jgi:hypothetical protein
MSLVDYSLYRTHYRVKMSDYNKSLVNPAHLVPANAGGIRKDK